MDNDRRLWFGAVGVRGCLWGGGAVPKGLVNGHDAAVGAWRRAAIPPQPAVVDQDGLVLGSRSHLGAQGDLDGVGHVDWVHSNLRQRLCGWRADGMLH